jgi:O-antigen/teichoic acid export membrane protein
MLFAFCATSWFATSSPAVDFVIVISLCNGTALIALLVVMRRAASSCLSFRSFRNHSRRLLRSGRWLALATGFQFSNEHLFLLAAGGIAGSFSLGVLRAAQSIVGIANPALYALEYLVPASLAKALRQGGVVHARRTYWLTVTFIFLSFAVLLGLVAFYADALLLVLTKGKAVGYGWVLQGLCAVYLLFVTQTLLVYWFRAVERTAPVMVANGLAAFVSVGICLPVVKTGGIGGAVFGVVLANSIVVASLSLSLALLLRRSSPERVRSHL